MTQLFDVTVDLFFDKRGTLAHVREGTRSPLAKAGAFVRRRAKSSIRQRKRISRPGEPPSSHTGLLRDRIFFGYDATTNSTIVGPEFLHSTRRKAARGATPVPELLEFGGTARSWRTGKPATWLARPFMWPALEEEAPKFPGLFIYSIGA